MKNYTDPVALAAGKAGGDWGIEIPESGGINIQSVDDEVKLMSGLTAVMDDKGQIIGYK